LRQPDQDSLVQPARHTRAAPDHKIHVAARASRQAIQAPVILRPLLHLLLLTWRRWLVIASMPLLLLLLLLLLHMRREGVGHRLARHIPQVRHAMLDEQAMQLACGEAVVHLWHLWAVGMSVGIWVYLRVCLCVCTRVLCACVRACVRACIFYLNVSGVIVQHSAYVRRAGGRLCAYVTGRPRPTPSPARAPFQCRAPPAHPWRPPASCRSRASRCSGRWRRGAWPCGHEVHSTPVGRRLLAHRRMASSMRCAGGACSLLASSPNQAAALSSSQRQSKGTLLLLITPPPPLFPAPTLAAALQTA